MRSSKVIVFYKINIGKSVEHRAVENRLRIEVEIRIYRVCVELCSNVIRFRKSPQNRTMVCSCCMYFQVDGFVIEISCHCHFNTHFFYCCLSLSSHTKVLLFSHFILIFLFRFSLIIVKHLNTHIHTASIDQRIRMYSNWAIAIRHCANKSQT